MNHWAKARFISSGLNAALKRRSSTVLCGPLFHGVLYGPLFQRCFTGLETLLHPCRTRWRCLSAAGSLIAIAVSGRLRASFWPGSGRS